MSLDTGIGALILFGAVQITIILMSLVSGTKLYFSEWVGVVTAFSGFVYLVMPKLTPPSLIGFILMTIAGISWGIYTLKGKSSADPLSDTAYNFIRTLPFILALIIFTFPDVILSQEGVLYAVLSGAFASGIGYAIWYVALGGLSATQAAVLQLFVPVIAAIGGVVFASETISPRLIVSSIMILGGILTVVTGRYYFVQVADSKT